MKKYITSILPPLLLTLLIGCAPGLGTSFDLSGIPSQSLDAGNGEELRIRVGNFVDRRASREIVKIDGRSVNPGSNIEEVVRSFVEAELPALNVADSALAVPRLTGEILAWRSKVEPGFPMSELSSEASLRLQLWGAGDNVIFSSTYSGEVQKKHPFPTESTIRSSLGEALGLALQEAVKDERFREGARSGGAAAPAFYQ